MATTDAFLRLIVAVDRAWGIGYRGQLLTRVREDMRRFRSLTEGKVVLLGSNTLATFPGGTPLPRRTNIVLHPDPAFAPEGATVAHSLPEILAMARAYPPEDVFVIGGASVYAQLLPYTELAYVTRFEQVFPADAFFPNLDEDPAWRCVDEGTPLRAAPTDPEPNLTFRFTEYRRV